MSTEIPLKLKYRTGGKSRQSSNSGGAGAKKIRRTLPKGEREAAQAATKANRPTLVLGANGKTYWKRPQ
jgi:hypothetical protein